MLTRKLGRKKAHRDHMLRNLAGSVMLYEKVETTTAKAKEVKRLVDRSINLAKKDNLAARRWLLGQYFDTNVVAKLFEVLIKRFADRSSGYTRLIRMTPRLGDAADRTLIMLIPEIKSDAKSIHSEQPPTDKAATKPTNKAEELAIPTQDPKSVTETQDVK